MRSIPVTRSGKGTPSSLPAQTTDIPSAFTSGQARMIPRSPGSSCIRTTLPAFNTTCWAGARAAINSRHRATVSPIVNASTDTPNSRYRRVIFDNPTPPGSHASRVLPRVGDYTHEGPVSGVRGIASAQVMRYCERFGSARPPA